MVTSQARDIKESWQLLPQPWTNFGTITCQSAFQPFMTPYHKQWILFDLVPDHFDQSQHSLPVSIFLLPELCD
jgi:hypothetical protein